jgi:glycosyltransferase involved in cell wall biosynthesis
MLTTVGDRCGIAAYTRDLVSALKKLVDVQIEPIEPGKLPITHYEEQAERLNQAEVVHIQHEHSFWGGILPNRSAFWNLRYLIHKPVVVTAHTTTSLPGLLRVKDEKRLPHRIAKELLVRRTAYRDSVEIAPFITGRCIVHTSAGRHELVARGAKPQYVHVIPAGIPEPLPASALTPGFREMRGLTSNRIISIFGYLAPNKGYEVALKALKSLPEEVVLVIAGGSRSSDMEDYAVRLNGDIEASGVGGRVIVTGFLSDPEVAEVMSESDLVLAPHTYATGSYSITVPLSYGKAVVASDQACFTEIAEEAGCLEIVPTGDAARLARTISRLLSDDRRRGDLERRADRYAKTRTWSVAAEKTVGVYREAIFDVERLAHHPSAARRS